MLHKKMKLFVRVRQGKIYPKPLSFHCLQFYASYARDCFQEIVLFKKWVKYMENWQFPATAYKDLSPPHLDM